jgi:hypothetical protein
MKNLVFLCIGIALSHLGYAQHAKPKLVEGVINKEAILSDIDDYAECLAKNHVDPFSYVRKSDFYEQLQHIKDSANGYNIDELLIKWLQLNALVQDEHTNIGYEAIVRDNFPFKCYLFEEGLYIVSATDANRQYLHSRIIAINGMPVKEIARRMATIIPDTNTAAIKYSFAQYLFDPFVLHGLGISTARGKVTYTLVSQKNDTTSITPVAVDKRETHLLKGFDPHSFLRTSIRERFGFKYLDSIKTVYFKYSSCVDDDAHPFKNVKDRLTELINEREPRKIIIDLRDNGGGKARLLKPFIDFLNTSSLNKAGSIYVLIGRRTFSAAILNSVYLKNQTHAILVGEETSGSVAHYGAVIFQKLPATRITMSYSTQYVVTNEKYDGSLKPDVLIPEKFTDYVAGTDAALDYAIAH